MFLGRKRKIRVKKVYVPTDLEKVSPSSFYDDFVTFKTTNFPSTILSLSTPRISESKSTPLVLTYQGMIEYRQYSEDRVTLSTFNEAQTNFYSLSFRDDGNVFACGSDISKIYLFSSFDSIKRPLREITIKSSHSTRSTKDHLIFRYVSFLTPTHIISGNETGEVEVHNILRNETIFKDSELGDSCRCGLVLNSNEFVAGSYNRKVRLYDLRASSKIVGNYNGEGPLESIVGFENSHDISSQKEILVVEKSIIKWLDFRKLGGNIIVNRWAAIHQKLITSIQRLPDIHEKKYILTTSLDGFGKIMKLSNSSKRLDIKKQFRFANPLFFGRYSGNNSHIFFADSKNTVLVSKSNRYDLEGNEIRSRNIMKLYKDERELVRSNYKLMINFDVLRNVHEFNHRILSKERRSEHTAKYKKYFADFRFKEILQLSIKREKDPIAVISIIEELKSRNELVNALDNRNEDELMLILEFIEKNLNDERFLSNLVELFGIILFYYGKVVGLSRKVDKMFRLIQIQINEKLSLLKNISELRGMIDMLLINNVIKKKK